MDLPIHGRQRFTNTGTLRSSWSLTTKLPNTTNLGALQEHQSSDGGYGGRWRTLWTTMFDHLGRITSLILPSGDDANPTTASISSTYDDVDTSTGQLGVLTTVTDQSGKVRRQKSEALGRVVRLDEPTTAGLGSISAPNQATIYEYDVLGNLEHVHQGVQDRYFKYDSLSRLIHDKQPELDIVYNHIHPNNSGRAKFL